MLKKEVKMIDFDEFGEEKERTVTVRFLYSLKAIRLYEQRTGRNFIDDNQKAARAYVDALLEIGIDNSRNLTEEEQLKLIPLLMGTDFLDFLMGAIPCLYGEVRDGRLVQDEFTAENAEFSVWVGELLNIQFYTELILEFNRFSLKVPQDRKKPQAKS
ncbi:TPA: hypothetical protein ACIRGN_000896 [Streptococcus suis]|nr:hypothetical protein [Streptococcus suis]